METIDMEKMYVPIKIKDDPLRREVEIEGMKYSYGIFEFFANADNIGKKFQYIEKIEKNVVILEVLEE